MTWIVLSVFLKDQVRWGGGMQFSKVFSRTACECADVGSWTMSGGLHCQELLASNTFIFHGEMSL